MGFESLTSALPLIKLDKRQKKYDSPNNMFVENLDTYSRGPTFIRTMFKYAFTNSAF